MLRVACCVLRVASCVLRVREAEVENDDVEDGAARASGRVAFSRGSGRVVRVEMEMGVEMGMVIGIEMEIVFEIEIWD